MRSGKFLKWLLRRVEHKQGRGALVRKKKSRQRTKRKGKRTCDLLRESSAFCVVVAPEVTEEGTVAEVDK